MSIDGDGGGAGGPEAGQRPELPQPPDGAPRIAAFFDMDRTIVSRNTGPLYVLYLREHGRMPRREVARVFWWALQYKLGVINMERVSVRALEGVAGESEAELRAFCERWVDEVVMQYVYPRAIALIAEHRAAGHVVAMLSASTQYATRPLAERLGIAHSISTQLEVVDGKLTGRVVEPMCYGAQKLYWARQFAGVHGVDLAQSYFYTDSITDLPVLQAMGRPRPVNADPRLRRAARRLGWAVEDWAPPERRHRAAMWRGVRRPA